MKVEQKDSVTQASAPRASEIAGFLPLLLPSSRSIERMPVPELMRCMRAMDASFRLLGDVGVRQDNMFGTALCVFCAYVAERSAKELEARDLTKSQARRWRELKSSLSKFLILQ
jgi:hypothetical protein